MFEAGTDKAIELAYICIDVNSNVGGVAQLRLLTDIMRQLE